MKCFVEFEIAAFPMLLVLEAAAKVSLREFT